MLLGNLLAMRPTYAYESLYCLLRRWKDKAGRSEK